MELRHLRYFSVVAEELHFARAAARLHIAQQPLSVQIRRLEDELGVTLFERTTRRVALTEAGRIFLEKAQETLRLADRAVDAAREAQRGERGRITIGYISTTLYNIMPPLVRAFRQQYPHIVIQLRELCSPELDQNVHEGRLDVGLIGTPVQDEMLRHLVLCREPVVVVMADTHPLAVLSEIPMAALDDQPFIQYDAVAKRYAHDQIVSQFHHAGLSLNVVQQANSEQAMIALAAADIGVALISASLMGLRQSEVVYRPLVAPVVHTEYSLIWKNGAIPATTQLLIETARTLFVPDRMLRVLTTDHLTS